jgi:hypothetical protein
LLKREERKLTPGKKRPKRDQTLKKVFFSPSYVEKFADLGLADWHPEEICGLIDMQIANSSFAA